MGIKEHEATIEVKDKLIRQLRTKLSQANSKGAAANSINMDLNAMEIKLKASEAKVQDKARKITELEAKVQQLNTQVAIHSAELQAEPRCDRARACCDPGKFHAYRTITLTAALRTPRRF